MSNACHTCQKEGVSSHCGRCKCTYYCSKKCQQVDWKYHKKICKMLANKSKNPTANTSNTNDDEKPTTKTTKTNQQVDWKYHNKICKSLVQKCQTCANKQEPLSALTSLYEGNIFDKYCVKYFGVLHELSIELYLNKKK
eukprot:274359_1